MILHHITMNAADIDLQSRVCHPFCRHYIVVHVSHFYVGTMCVLEPEGAFLPTFIPRNNYTTSFKVKGFHRQGACTFLFVVLFESPPLPPTILQQQLS